MLSFSFFNTIGNKIKQSLVTFLSLNLNGDLSTDANGDRYLVSSKGVNIPSTTGGGTQFSINNKEHIITEAKTITSKGGAFLSCNVKFNTIESGEKYLFYQANNTIGIFVENKYFSVYNTTSSEYKQIGDIIEAGKFYNIKVNAFPTKKDIFINNKYIATVDNVMLSSKDYEVSISKAGIDAGYSNVIMQDLIILNNYLPTFSFLNVSPEDMFMFVKNNSDYKLTFHNTKITLTNITFGTGNIYYLSTNGEDNNNGDINTPFGTISHAIDTLRKGDTLYIRGGTYTTPTTYIHLNYAVRSGNTGTSENDRIVIMPYQEEEVIIDGSNYIYDGNGFEGILQAYQVSYLTIKDIQFINSDFIGLAVVGGTAYGNNIIQGVKTKNTYSSGIFFSSSGIIEGCEVNEYKGNFHEAISLYGVVDTTVRYNYVHDGGNASNGIGIDAKNGCTNVNIYGNKVDNMTTVGIYIDSRGMSSNINIYDNYITNCKSIGISIADENTTIDSNYADSVMVYRNMIKKSSSGIVLGYSVEAPNPFQNIHIFHNTALECWNYGIRLDTTAKDINSAIEVFAHDLHINNNIFYNTGNIPPNNIPEATPIFLNSNAKMDNSVISNNIMYKSNTNTDYSLTIPTGATGVTVSNNIDKIPNIVSYDNPYSTSNDASVISGEDNYHTSIGAYPIFESILNMPLNEVGAIKHDYVSGSDYTLTNYTTDCDVQGLSTGLQNIAFNTDMTYADTMGFDVNQPNVIVATIV